MKKIYTIILVFLVLSISSNSQAQTSRLETYWSVGFQVNAFNYFGDLNPLHEYFGTRFDFTRPGLAINASKKLSKHWHIRGAFGFGRLRGDDFKNEIPNTLEKVARYGRNLHFRNTVYELSFVGIYEFKASKGRFYRRSYFTPYLFGGIAGFYHNPKAKVPEDFNGPEAGDWVALRPLSTEGQGLNNGYEDTPYGKKYSLFQVAFPVGAGIKFRLSDRLDFSFESGFRILITDHIDDAGGFYPDMRDLRDQLGDKAALAIVMSDRSTETIAAVSGKTRDLATAQSFVGTAQSTYGTLKDLNNLETIIINGEQFTRLASYGIRGDIRGDGNRKGSNGFAQNDLYLVTGFHLNYVLTTKRHPRYRVR